MLPHGNAMRRCDLNFHSDAAGTDLARSVRQNQPNSHSKLVQNPVQYHNLKYALTEPNTFMLNSNNTAMTAKCIIMFEKQHNTFSVSVLKCFLKTVIGQYHWALGMCGTDSLVTALAHAVCLWGHAGWCICVFRGNTSEVAQPLWYTTLYLWVSWWYRASLPLNLDKRFSYW